MPNKAGFTRSTDSFYAWNFFRDVTTASDVSVNQSNTKETILCTNMMKLIICETVFDILVYWCDWNLGDELLYFAQKTNGIVSLNAAHLYLYDDDETTCEASVAPWSYCIPITILLVKRTMNPWHFDCGRSIPVTHAEFNDSILGRAFSGFVLSSILRGYQSITWVCSR